MCESSVFILKNGQEELVMENVDRLENHKGSVKIVNLFGEEKTLDAARVKTLSLLDHKIIIEPL